MEGRMTLCNLTIEGGARAGLIAPDETTFAYMMGRPHAPKGAGLGDGRQPGARSIPTRTPSFDARSVLDAAKIAPTVTWGTSPEDVVAVTGNVPNPAELRQRRQARGRRTGAGLYGPHRRPADHRGQVDVVFIGSCTNSRIEDLRAAAKIAQGRKVADGVRAMVVPGSGLVKAQAEDEGLDVDLHGRRLRLARAGLLDVPGHEPRPARTRRALRLDLEPQLRGPPGQGAAAPT
jgi:3-isopropylmalate/(R)-2-methylmalate dehydratase large subunit